MSKLRLILAFHNHQPVGNFEHVLEECYMKSYLPFLETILDHPNLKVVLHYSGNLLSWLCAKHPEAIGMIRMLVDGGRAELLSGGFYEPVMTVLPERDRTLQITEMSKYIKKHLGYEPKGMWLAERVWEPQMPRTIARAGIEYLPIDDYHFKLTGLGDGDLLGYYITEDGGQSVHVFPGSERLRYMIPFGTIDDIFSYFREIHMRGGDSLLTMADDGEKFGVWPNTYKHCYENRWLDDFLSALERNSDWVETTTFSEYQSKFRPIGRVSMPTASYREMGEWALTTEACLEYEYVLEEMKKMFGEKSKSLLRGSTWRSFMVKYPESNHIHKRMLRISDKVHQAMKVQPRKGQKGGVKRADGSQMLHELWRGQCNDAYWHGIFGGLYLPHLRSALYRHLVSAEALAESAIGELPRVERSDFDCDGSDDLLVTTKHMTLAASQLSGSVNEISLFRQKVNLFDILSRRTEAYHSKITRISAPGEGQTKTIHDQITLKEDNLSEHLIYDTYRRSSFIDHFLPAETGVADMMRSKYQESGDFVGGLYDLRHSVKGKNIVISLSRDGLVDHGPVRVEKTITVPPSSGLKIAYRIEGRFSGIFATELNISLLGSPFSMITAADKQTMIRSIGSYGDISWFTVDDKYLDLKVRFRFSMPMDLWHYPVETVSLSEQGIERLYQGTSFLIVLNKEQQDRKGFTITMDMGTD